MIVKIVNGNEESLNPCTHINTTTLDASELQKELGLPEGPGKWVRLFPDGPNFLLPKDGSVAYVMNDQGDTIQTIRWPENRGGK